MKILIIDTTWENLVVVGINDKKEYIRNIQLDKLNHQKTLLNTIDEVLKECAMGIGEVDAIAVVVGPGSFTGIRIGISTALGLSFESDTKRVELNAFEVIGYKYTGKVAVDAGHGNSYIAKINNGIIEDVTFLEGKEIKSGYIQRSDINYVKNLISLTKDKISSKKYSEGYTPFYVRPSQAERNSGK